jgi:hypothetical protein
MLRLGSQRCETAASSRAPKYAASEAAQRRSRGRLLSKGPLGKPHPVPRRLRSVAFHEVRPGGGPRSGGFLLGRMWE